MGAGHTNYVVSNNADAGNEHREQVWIQIEPAAWKTRVDDDHTCAVAQYNTPSGEVSLINGEAVAEIYLKYGERDGAEDGNKDRAYLSTDARGTATNQVDYPQGLGSFVSFSGDERSVNVGIHDDGAIAAPAGSSYGIWVR